MNELPSMHPVVLMEQLRNALTMQDPASAEPFVSMIILDAVRGIHLGDSSAPSRWILELWKLSADFQETPQIASLLKFLHLSEAAVRYGTIFKQDIQMGKRLKKVLKCLFENRGTPLSQESLAQLLAHEVGSALGELLEEGMLLRVSRPADKPDSVYHYGLSARGMRLCRELKMGGKPHEPILHLLTDDDLTDEERLLKYPPSLHDFYAIKDHPNKK